MAKYLHAKTIVNNSFPVVEYLVPDSFRVLDAKAIGRLFRILPGYKIDPIA